MPKFIWVAEIITDPVLNEGSQKVDTTVILDATESGFLGNLIIAFNYEYVVDKRFVDGKIEYFVKDMAIGTRHNTFSNNLKGKHTEWKSRKY